MKLVFVRLGDVKDFNVAALHSHCEPLSCRTVAEREDLDERDEKLSLTWDSDEYHLMHPAL